MIRDTLTIAKFTLIQINKSKILVNVIFLSVAIALVSYVLSEFTHGVPSKISLDIGFGLASLSSVGIAIFLGVQLLSQEMDSRTIYMIISRLVSRVSFYLGKMLGMSTFLLLNTILVSMVALSVYLKLNGPWTNLFIVTILSIALEAILTLFVVVSLALIVNNVISVVTTIALYVVGHGIEDAKNITYVVSRPWLENLLCIYSKVMPNFSQINLKRYLLYSLDLYPNSWGWSLVYALFYILFLATISILVLRNKNLD